MFAKLKIPIGEPVKISFIDPISQKELLGIKGSFGTLIAANEKINIFSVRVAAKKRGEVPAIYTLGRENISRIH